MKITKGKIQLAKKVVIYGPEGIGKSTFAAQFPEPLFIDTEGSTNELDVARFDKPSSWAMLLQQIDYVISYKPCKTLVIDTVDWAEALCLESVCAAHGKKGIEARQKDHKSYFSPREGMVGYAAVCELQNALRRCR